MSSLAVVVGSSGAITTITTTANYHHYNYCQLPPLLLLLLLLLPYTLFQRKNARQRFRARHSPCQAFCHVVVAAAHGGSDAAVGASDAGASSSGTERDRPVRPPLRWDRQGRERQRESVVVVVDEVPVGV